MAGSAGRIGVASTGGGRPLKATITEFQLYAVDLPFKVSFRHAAAVRTSSESLFLWVRLDSGAEGWGESLPRAYVSGESRADDFALLRDAILPALVGTSFPSLPEVVSFLERCDGKAPPEWVPPHTPQSAAWCSVDLALLDVFGRASGEPVSLGGQPPAADALRGSRYSGVVSAGQGWPYAVSLLKMRAFRFPHVKLKVERDGTLPAARTARRLLGRRADLRVDANMAWDVDQALELIGQLGSVGIRSFEQPIAAGDLAGLARLVAESPGEIMVDEGLTDRDSLRRFITHRACTAANVRISKCGGLVGAYARCREALDAGLILQVGCWKGGTVGAYLAKFGELFPQGPPVRDFGYYATELRGSVPLRDEGDAGVSAVGTNVLEFYPDGEDRAPEGHELLPLDRLEEGQRYFVFVTNASGLYRYEMNDIVEVAGLYGRAPLIRFIQKGKGVVSFTGEKLYEVQVIAAVDQALASLRGRYHFIAAVAELVDGTVPRLVFLIEFDDGIADIDGSALVDRLDAALGDHNEEYQTKRKSLRYGAPIIRVIRSGEFDQYRRRMVESGQRADGQFKVLRLTSDTSFAAEFEAERDLVGGDRTSA